MKRRLWSKRFRRSYPLAIAGGVPVTFLFIFISLLGIAYSLLSPQGVSSLRTMAYDLTAPALYVVTKPAQDAATFVRNISGLAALQAENLQLQQENIKLREWYQTAIALQSENESLRNLMHVKVEPQNRFITARIIADTGYSFARSLLIYAGQDDGVRKGQAVISAEGVIGRIIEAADNVSRVLLIDDMNSRVPVLIEKTGHHAILAGQNADQPILIHLPPELQLEESERVITSGHGGVFPYGLPIGVVRIGQDEQPYVSLYADFDKMVYVRVIDKSEDPNLQRGASESLAKP